MMVASLCDSWCEIDWRMLSQVFVSVILVNEMYWTQIGEEDFEQKQ